MVSKSIICTLGYFGMYLNKIYRWLCRANLMWKCTHKIMEMCRRVKTSEDTRRTSSDSLTRIRKGPIFYLLRGRFPHEGRLRLIESDWRRFELLQRDLVRFRSHNLSQSNLAYSVLHSRSEQAFKGWFTLDTAVCIFHSRLCQCRDRKFPISLRKHNCPLQNLH